MRRVYIGFIIILAGLFFSPLHSQAPETAQVSISLDQRQDPPQIIVEPDTVSIRVQDRVEWRIDGNSSDTVMIDFGIANGVRGPFDASNQEDNRERGRYRSRASDRIRTQPAGQSGEWKYSITWETAGGVRYELDPVVTVRER